MNNIPYTLEYTKIKHSTKPEGQPFALHDLLSFIQKFDNKRDIIFIDTFIATPETRDSGEAELLLSDFISQFEDSGEFILLVSSMSKKQFPIEPTREEMNIYLEDMDEFLLRNNFINVNDLIGNYETKTAYLYNNNAYEILNTLLRLSDMY